MNIKVEFLLEHTDDVFSVGRIPCVGELVFINDKIYEVKQVTHRLNANPETQVMAFIRVV